VRLSAIRKPSAGRSLWWRLLPLWPLLLSAALAAEDRAFCPIPLEKGTKWVYEAQVKWTPVAGSGLKGVQAARLKWTAEVVASVPGKSARAAVVHAFPMEVLGMDPAEPKGYTVLVATSNRLYSAEADTAREAVKLAKKLVASPRQVALQAEVLLELPLQLHKRWGDISDGPARDDGWYCWNVEAVKAERLRIAGFSPSESLRVWTIAFRTCPDHQLLEVVPGVGLVHLQYEHHGTVGEEDVRLVEFKPNPPAAAAVPR
jgi:hypothetical protein